MWSKEEKEVTEVLFCKQMIRILIASIIEIMISKTKPIFDVLIKSLRFEINKNTVRMYLPSISFFCLSRLVQDREIQFTAMFP